MQLSGLDIIEIAVDIYVPWRSARVTDTPHVAVQRLREVFEADVVGIPQISDVLSEFLLEGLDKALRRKVCSATVRVVNNGNIVDIEEMARNANR